MGSKNPSVYYVLGLLQSEWLVMGQQNRCHWFFTLFSWADWYWWVGRSTYSFCKGSDKVQIVWETHIFLKKTNHFNVTTFTCQKFWDIFFKLCAFLRISFNDSNNETYFPILFLTKDQLFNLKIPFRNKVFSGTFNFDHINNSVQTLVLVTGRSRATPRQKLLLVHVTH